jgi:hypothetical protein
MFFLEIIEKKKEERLRNLQLNNNIKSKDYSLNVLNKKRNVKSLNPFIKKKNDTLKEEIKEENNSEEGLINLKNKTFYSNKKINILNDIKNRQTKNCFLTQNKFNPSTSLPYKKEEKKVDYKSDFLEKSEIKNSLNLNDMNKCINNSNYKNMKIPSKTFTNGFRSPLIKRNLIPHIYKETNIKIKDNYKRALEQSKRLKNDLNIFDVTNQQTIKMRNYVNEKHERKRNRYNYDFLKEKKQIKERNIVKGIFNVAFKEMIYIDENKANIVNHIDTVLKMRNENFYKFKDVCIDKYNNYAKKNDIFEYVWSNKRYVPNENNYKKIDDNTYKLRCLFAKMKKTNADIYKVLSRK